MKTRIRLSNIKIWWLWVGLLAGIMLAGATAGVSIFRNGLWVTNLSNLVPWGLWITIDLSSIALSAGAFFLCAGVYLLGLKRYEPVARTATFIGLIGYSMAMLSLLLDIGRPDRFWHALVYWNKHSLLWEVTMCVILYMTVLVMENMPTFASFSWLRERFPLVASRMEHVHHYAPYLAIVGLGLSMLHQSSLGAVYGVLKARPFWYKPEMAVLFMISAIAGGTSLTVFASMFAARVTPRARVNDALLERLAHFIGWVLVVYFYFRFWDVLATTYTYQPGRNESLHLLTSGELSFNFWVGEILTGIFIPMLLLLNKRTRLNPNWRMSALLMVVGGLVAFRWDTNLSGLLVVLSYLPGEPVVQYTTYYPSLLEYLSGFGIVAFGLLMFSLGVRHLRVVDHRLMSGEAVKTATSSEAAETISA